MLHVMFRGEALRYITNRVLAAFANTDDAFTKLEAYFLTPAHKDAYTTKWNTLSFREIRQKHPDKTTPEVLDCLFQRARQLQSLLDETYQSPIHLRDCIIKAVKIKQFHVPFTAGEIPNDPKGATNSSESVYTTARSCSFGTSPC